MKCRLIQSKNHEVFYNLAIEHAIALNAAETSNTPTIRIWKNQKSVIMGRGQDIKKEVNEQFCVEHGIEIARRISGGGAVYHDLGNINLSFFLSPYLKKRMDIHDLPSISHMMTTILLETLELMDYNGLKIEGGSNIFYRGKKISGSAGYLYKGWNLHHATLLTSTDLNMLNGSLLGRERDPKDKKQSRYFETINLPNFNYSKWLESLTSILFSKFQIEIFSDVLSDDENNLAQNLLKDLYKTKKWILESKRNN